VTKWAVTVREPAQVPRAFQQAFHLMRSGRPGPVLIDLPFDVQTTEIEFDPETYSPLPVYKPGATRAQAAKAIAMLQEAERPLIVAGGGIINADACDLLLEFCELTGVPVVPTLMAWGCIPDDHPLMAGMCGLQTSHRYGNATMLASDFVLGIGNRWANRHTGSIDVYTKGRKFVHVDIEPTQIGRVFAPDYGIVSDAKAALQLFVEVARELQAGRQAEGRTAWAGDCLERKRTMLRKTNFDDVPMKPQRVYQCMNRNLPARHLLRQHHRPVADRRRAVPARVQPAQLDQLRPGRPAGMDHPRRAGRARRRPDAQDRRAVGRLRLPVHDRGAGGGRAVQAALPARGGEQLLPRPDPAGAARLRHGLLRAAGLRQHQHVRRGRAGARLRRRPREGGGGPGLQGDPRAHARRTGARHRASRGLDEGVAGAGGGRGDPGARDQHLHGHRDRQAALAVAMLD
jgi:hypothetical protein